MGVGTVKRKLKGGSIEEEIIVSGSNGSVLPNGTTLQAGMSLTNILKRILVSEIFPAYVQPVSSITSSQTGSFEKGTTIAPTLARSFTQNDAGELNLHVLERNLVELYRDDSKPITYPNFVDSYVIGKETVTYKSTFAHDEGAEKLGNQGSVAPGKIAAATRTNTVTVTGILPWFYGSNVDGLIPADIYTSGTKVLAAVATSGGASIVVPSFGVGDKYLWFAVPKGSKEFTTWYRSALDNGSIGGGANLFKSRVVDQAVTSTVFGANNWTELYDFYITNYTVAADISTTLS